MDFAKDDPRFCYLAKLVDLGRVTSEVTRAWQQAKAAGKVQVVSHLARERDMLLAIERALKTRDIDLMEPYETNPQRRAQLMGEYTRMVEVLGHAETRACQVLWDVTSMRWVAALGTLGMCWVPFGLASLSTSEGRQSLWLQLPLLCVAAALWRRFGPRSMKVFLKAVFLQVPFLRTTTTPASGFTLPADAQGRPTSQDVSAHIHAYIRGGQQ
mmetsp:Transcript_49583/g.105515  ORF Transcript_49583/g.105515 Transcript_49583/m.105515 type:complete len:213 (-) Transcript_49583:468-1106(-)